MLVSSLFLVWLISEYFYCYSGDTLIKAWAFLFIHGWQVKSPKMAYLFQRREVGKQMLSIECACNQCSIAKGIIIRKEN